MSSSLQNQKNTGEGAKYIETKGTQAKRFSLKRRIIPDTCKEIWLKSFDFKRNT